VRLGLDGGAGLWLLEVRVYDRVVRSVKGSRGFVGSLKGGEVVGGSMCTGSGAEHGWLGLCAGGKECELLAI